ncbi:MAG: 23S rRNA (adenine(2503)-C(2))-methyltransferase RlmN [Clostridiaceae bacterium]|nr:23S rRNA (adenine(2503)-C(2))-methyltransferase RlmN [Clostridiaceae bacterium]
MSELLPINSMRLSELETALSELGEPKYKAAQIFRWLSLGVSSFDDMSDISKAVRTKLSEKYYIEHIDIITKQCSKIDGTIKYLFGLSDGNSIESVLMKYLHGYSICISTQAGCKMGCVFCASFEKGATRNLTAGEILLQIIEASKDSGEKISNIVLMGTGEPLDNYDNVMTFLDIISHDKGVNIGMRHISLSTCGLVPKIYELAGLKKQLTLSISLHAPNNEIRSQLMPVNKKYDIESLMKACRYYFDMTGRRISFEYAMISGVNDTRECAFELAKLLKGFNCHVNLIPLNHIEGSLLDPSKKEDLAAFQSILEKSHITTTVRRHLGSDIDASCGQLRRRMNVRR